MYELYNRIIYIFRRQVFFINSSTQFEEIASKMTRKSYSDKLFPPKKCSTKHPSPPNRQLSTKEYSHPSCPLITPLIEYIATILQVEVYVGGGSVGGSCWIVLSNPRRILALAALTGKDHYCPSHQRIELSVCKLKVCGSMDKQVKKCITFFLLIWQLVSLFYMSVM